MNQISESTLQNERNDYTVESIPSYLKEPPDDLPPGVAGTFLDNSADMRDIVATLLDLARRGVISIRELQAGQRVSHLSWLDSDFEFTLNPGKYPLIKAEVKLIEEFFGDDETRQLKDWNQDFFSLSTRAALYEEAIRWNLYPEASHRAFVTSHSLGLSIIFTILISLYAASFIPTRNSTPFHARNPRS